MGLDGAVMMVCQVVAIFLLDCRAGGIVPHYWTPGR